MMNPQTLPSADELLRLDHQLCFAMYSASLAMTRLYKPLLAPLGLTYPQYLALLVLWEADDLPVSELGARLFLDSGTLTPLLKRMEAAGWVQRQRSVTDERRVHIQLTPQGRELRTTAARIPACLVQTLPCSLPEVSALTRQLQVLRDRLLAVSPPAPNP